MFVVDTNLLLYAADRASPFHKESLRLLDKWRAQPGAWYTTWGILYEFLRVSTHPAVFARPWSADEAWQFIASLLASPGLQVLIETGRHAQALSDVIGQTPQLAGNIMHDVHAAALMLEHGVKVIHTKDAHFHRFAFLTSIDPLASKPRPATKG